MATSPRSRGADFRLYGKTEGTPGTAPSGDWSQLPCFSFTLGGRAEIQDDPVLSASAETTRDSQGLFLGRETVDGQAVVPVDLINFGTWLRLLLGAPTTTGSSDYVHTWDSGAVSLPSMSTEKHLTRISDYALSTFVKANTMSLGFDPEGAGAVRATLGLMGQDEAHSGSSAAGTPTVAAFTPFRAKHMSLTDDASTFLNVAAFTLDYSNNLEAKYGVGSGIVLEGIDEGRATCSGTAQVRVASDTVDLIADAKAETSHAFVAAFTISSTKLLSFTMPDILLSQPTVVAEGPNGMDVTFNWRARYNTAAGYMMRAVLKNQISAYS